jgi:hypothetical protein
MTQIGTPGTPPLTPPQLPAYQLLPGESPDILVDVADVVPIPGWLDAPNVNLGGYTPRSLIGTDREVHLRELLRAIKYGLFT